MKICNTHKGKEFKLREGKFGPFYSHTTEGSIETGFKYHSANFGEIDSEIMPEVDISPVYIKDSEAEGKTRCQVAVAFIKTGVTNPDEVREVMDKWVRWIMEGSKI